MRDYNFFSEFIYTKSSFRIRKLIVPILFIIVIAAIVGTFLLLEIKENDKQEILDTKTEYLESKEVRDTLREVELLIEEVATLNVLTGETILFDMLITKGFSVTEFITEAVGISLPRNIAFTSYTISRNTVSIEAYAIAYADIAEFENNLRDMSIFYNIFVSDIAYDEKTELYTFALNIVIGGEEDE